jgi:hypothetical protein
MVCLRSGKCKDPPISHSFFLNGEFSQVDEKKGLQTVERNFSSKKKRNFATFGGEK